MPQLEPKGPLNGKRSGKMKSEQAEVDAKDLTEDVAEPEIVKVEASPVVQEAPEPDPAILELKRQLEAEKAARLQDQQARAQAERFALAARNETEDTNLRLVENALETVKANQNDLKRQYAAAAAIGDWDKAADVQEQMATNGARLLQLENGKQAMQEAAKKPKPQPVVDPVEALAAQLTPRSAAWVRAHPEYARDKKLYAKMIAAHNLVADDHDVDSDGYFGAIEDVLKLRPLAQAETEDEAFSEAAAPVHRRSSPPAAPVSRSNLSTGSSSPKQIRLTPEQVEIAAMNKMTPKEYWDQLQRARTAGEIH